MSSVSPFVTIDKPGEEAIRWVFRRLSKRGLRVVRTFDLQEARLSHGDCQCPHHGSEECGCQMLILLVYAGSHSPASMLVHSFQESTWLYLVDTPEQPVELGLEMLIQECLSRPNPASLGNPNPGYAHETT
jgi:hypothetical protein